MDSRPITIRNCLMETVKFEGYAGLWKGIQQPLMTATPINSIVFIMNSYTSRYLDRKHPTMSSTLKQLISGAFAGLASMVIFVPADLLKCRAQVKFDGTINYTQETKAIINEQGFRGMYRGLTACALRDVPGWGIYFCTFEYLKQFQMSSNFTQTIWNLNAAGVAGVCSWACSIP